MGDRGPRSRHRKVTNSNPQSANPQSAQSLAIGSREARALIEHIHAHTTRQLPTQSVGPPAPEHCLHAQGGTR
eukprot:3800455-Alexandrium_andersonii.AAC.1